MLIGLTGNIGAGKTTVLREFARLGAKTVELDKVAHKLYEKGAPLYFPIAQAFPDCLTKEGNVSREKLRVAVFQSPSELKKLNSMIAPLLRSEIIKIKHAGKVVVVEAAILFEAKIEGLFDKIIYVKGSHKKDVGRILVTQSKISEKDKIKASGFKIDNTKTLSETKVQVRSVWKKLKSDVKS